MPRPYSNLAGRTFGRLTVLSDLGMIGEGRSRRRYCLCKCACGKSLSICRDALMSGNTRSCGCYRPPPKYGIALNAFPEYQSWTSMLYRCLNPKCSNYKHYGGRGITVCARWRESFAYFLMDVGPKPSPRHTIDRYPDNNGNYEPGNVRWATAREQATNTRRNVNLTINGVTRCMLDWANLAGIHWATVQQRIRRKYPLEQLLKQPGACHVAPTLECLRCGHGWPRRNLTKLPSYCPKCNSPYWDRPRRDKLTESGERFPLRAEPNPS